MGGQELSAIYDGPARNTAQWIQRGQLDYEEAKIISGRAYWTLQFAVGLGERFARPKEPNMAVVEELVQTQSPGRSLVSALAVHLADLPPVVGKQEFVAMIVGEDAMHGLPRLDHAVKTGTFPAPDWKLSGSPLWLLDNALEGAARMNDVPKAKPVVIDEEVARSLREGTYTGPGSVILTRGVSKKS
ncbi:hypothetical protein [Kitasatospora purpeofusca]|uniref:hypothetical protein n=1 Tax=Kitasatospora purpeofusca TaxID=67352 RepID=UPI002A5AC9F4|nr:hypothetical protein [Kitasatospora purpeofusca]MDY0811433.1 hypothetical protein [Kitasatospora purpeofusca]